MLIRIVKMSFHKQHIAAFLENFELNKQKIRNVAGNRLLELYQDKNNECLFFTYSHWDSQDDLDNYHKSVLFGQVWRYTKTLFDELPQAWSVDKLVSLG